MLKSFIIGYYLLYGKSDYWKSEQLLRRLTMYWKHIDVIRHFNKESIKNINFQYAGFDGNYFFLKLSM